MSLYQLSELIKIYGSEKLDNYKASLKDTAIKGIHQERIVYNKNCLNRLLIDIKAINSIVIGLQLYKDVLLIEAYESATIEGAKTTIEEVKSGKNTKDTYMVKDVLAAAKLAYSSSFTIDLDSTCDIWKIVTQNVCENKSQQLNHSKFRTGMVYVGYHIPEKPEKIESKLNLFFENLEQSNENIFIKAALLYFYIVYIHPFCDGNGRTARICFNSFLYQSGIKNINKIALSQYINKEKYNYYKSLSESEKSVKIGDDIFIDITPSIYYMLSILKEALMNMLSLQNELSENEKELLFKIQTKGKEFEITVKECSKILSISELRCRGILNNLTNKGYFSKRKEKAKNIYTLLID